MPTLACTCRQTAAKSTAVRTLTTRGKGPGNRPKNGPVVPPTIVRSKYTPEPPTSSIASTSAIKLLRSQPSHYALIELHGRRLLVTPNDLVTVPRMKDVRAGDVIQLTRILEVGSRDYTLRAPFVPRVRDPKRYRMGASVERAVLPSEGDEGVQLKAVVVEHTSGPMEKRIKHTMGSKHVIRLETRERYTRLRIGPVHLAPGSSVVRATPFVDAAKRSLLDTELVPRVSSIASIVPEPSAAAAARV